MQGEQKKNNNDNNNTSWIRKIFGGTFTNETRCSCCETITRRKHPYIDLSVENYGA